MSRGFQRMDFKKQARVLTAAADADLFKPLPASAMTSSSSSGDGAGASSLLQAAVADLGDPTPGTVGFQMPTAKCPMPL
eukprot:6908479-Alexandrium_andersonii.AAC.1